MSRTTLTLAALTLASPALAKPVDLLTNPDGLADAPVGLEGGWSLSAGIAGSGKRPAHRGLRRRASGCGPTWAGA